MYLIFIINIHLYLYCYLFFFPTFVYISRTELKELIEQKLRIHVIVIIPCYKTYTYMYGWCNPLGLVSSLHPDANYVVIKPLAMF